MMGSSNQASLRLLCFILLLALGNAIDRWRVQDDTSTPYNTNFEIDEERSLIVIATVNKLYHLSLDLKHQTDTIEVLAESEAISQCRDVDLRTTTCQNFHRILILPQGQGQITGLDGQVWNTSDTLLACGSNSYLPLCHYRNRSSLESIVQFSAEGFHPYQPYEWIPSLWTSLGKLFVGTPMGEGHSQHGLAQSPAPYNGEVSLITVRNDVDWFSKIPHFVSMHEIGDYIYVFFREEATEAQQVVYSRVARICKNDTGIFHNNAQIFSTFIKARISCTTSNNAPTFHYNEIHGTYYSEEDNKIYAVFQTAINGPLGSAMCAFSFGDLKNDLDRVFHTSYLVRSGSEQYDRQPNPNPFTCLSGSRSTAEVTSNLLMNGVAVPTNSTEPLVKMEGVAFQRIIMQRVNDVEVFFITATKKDTNSLVLLKVSLLASTYHLLQTTTLPTDGTSSGAVTSMKIHGTGTTAKLYIGTETEIFRVPLQQCTNYESCCECVTSRDPYCAYDIKSESCESYISGVNASSSLMQELVNGDVGVCSVGTPESSDNTDGIVPTATTSDKSYSCSGGVKPSAGGVSDGKTSSSMVKVSPSPDVSDFGLQNSRNAQNFYSLIIVGVIAGFIGGVVIGILTMAIFKRLGCTRSRRNKVIELTKSVEISNDTKSQTPGYNTTSSKNLSSSIGTGGQLKEENLHINNRPGKDFTNSNHTPQHQQQQQQQQQHQHQQQHKEGGEHAMIKPIKYNSTHSEDSGVADCSSTKMMDMPTPPLQSTSSPPPPAAALLQQQQGPGNSKHRAQGEIFTFAPSSIHYGSPPNKKPRGGGGVPSTPPYATSPYTKSMPGGASRHNSPGKFGGTLPRDPNFQRNYKAEVHVTKQQQEAYGRNILARTPSIDGSKSKYIYSTESENRTLPHPQRFHRRQDVVHIDAEMGCSQC